MQLALLPTLSSLTSEGNFFSNTRLFPSHCVTLNANFPCHSSQRKSYIWLNWLISMHLLKCCLIHPLFLYPVTMIGGDDNYLEVTANVNHHNQTLASSTAISFVNVRKISATLSFPLNSWQEDPEKITKCSSWIPFSLWLICYFSFNLSHCIFFTMVLN